MSSCFILREVEQQLRQVLYSRGFKEILVPTITKYHPTNNQQMDRQVVKFVDRVGSVCSLRNDFTTVVMQMVQMGQIEVPAKIAYFGRVFRQQEGLKEIYQAGIEILSDDSLEADIEALEMVVAFCRIVAPERHVICLGLSTIARRLAATLNLSPQQQTALHDFLSKRDYVGARNYLHMNCDAASAEDLWAVFTENNVQKTLAIAKKYLPTDIATSHLEKLLNINLPNVRLDLGLIREPHYYTGVVFEAYVPDYPYPILAGGRYNGRGDSLGLDLSAVGFCVELNYLLQGGGA